MRMFFIDVPGLPSYRDVYFKIEFHPGTNPISMTQHRSQSTELQELEVQFKEL